jgi:hypothetical protein
VFKWPSRHANYKPSKRACELASVGYLRTHQQGRRTFGSWLRDLRQTHLRGLMEDGGWANLQSVIRYAHLVPGETADAISKLPSAPLTAHLPGTVTKYLTHKKKHRILLGDSPLRTQNSRKEKRFF